MSTSWYLPLICASCRRTLRVRSAYLGRMVTCNRCDHQFLAPKVSARGCISPSGESPSVEAEQIRRLVRQNPGRRENRRKSSGSWLKSPLRQRLERAEGWERTLGENECRHRTEIDQLAHELRIASTQTSLAVQREHALSDQLQIAQQELEDLRQQLAPGDPRCFRRPSWRLRQELDATEAERDRLAQERAEAELGSHSIHDHHRDQLESLQYDLQEARRWEEIGVERESELLGQIQDLRSTLDLYEERLEDQRRGHQEGSTALALELEAMFRQKLADECLRSATLQEQLDELRAELEQNQRRTDNGRDGVDESSDEASRDFDAEYDPQMTDELDARLILEGEPDSEDSTRLREELSLLHNQLEVLKKQRDDATEQAGMLRLDRDRLQGCLARLEARVQEVEEESRRAILQRASDAADGQRELEVAIPREVELRTQLDSIETQIHPDGAVETTLPLQPHKTDPQPFTHQPAPPPFSFVDSPDDAAHAGNPEQAPHVAARPATDTSPADSHGPDNRRSRTTREPCLTCRLAKTWKRQLETDPETDRDCASRAARGRIARSTDPSSPRIFAGRPRGALERPLQRALLHATGPDLDEERLRTIMSRAL